MTKAMTNRMVVRVALQSAHKAGVNLTEALKVWRIHEAELKALADSDETPTAATFATFSAAVRQWEGIATAASAAASLTPAPAAGASPVQATTPAPADEPHSAQPDPAGRLATDELAALLLERANAAGVDDAEIQAALGIDRAVLEMMALGADVDEPPDLRGRAVTAIDAWNTGRRIGKRKKAALPVEQKTNTKAALATAPGAPPLTECITVFEAIDTCGKTFEPLPDGSVKKESTLKAGIMNATIVHVPDTDALAAVLRGVMGKPNAGVILHAVQGLSVGDNFMIYPMAGLAQFLGVPVDASNQVAEADRPRLAGVHTINGILMIARMKENFTSSAWALLDRDVDEHTPSQFDGTNLPFDAWLALLDDKLMPGVAACERIVVPSSSARVARVDGPDAGNPVGAGNGHVFVRLTGDLSRLPAIASQITAKAQLAGVAWPKPRFGKTTRQKIGESPATIIDQTVMNIGRLVFDGLPHLIGNGLMHLPTEMLVHHGPAYDLAAFADISDADVAAFNAKGSTKLIRNKSGGVSRHDYGTLKMDTPLDLGGGAKMTVAEWEASGRPRTRIQAPFRASSSMAAFIDRDPLRVYDSGTDTTYYLANPDPTTAFSAIPPSPSLASSAASSPAAPSPSAAPAAPNWVVIGDEPEEPPEGQWVLRGLIDEGDLAVVYGAPGSAKTWLAVSMSVHLAAAREWFAHETAASIGVVYVANENSPGVRRRIRTQAQAMGAELAALPLVVTRKPVNMKGDFSGVLTQVQAAHAALTARFAVRHVLLVFDTLARVWGGINDNAAEDMGMVIGHCDALRGLGYTVLLVHHTGKDSGKGPRGHSSLLGAVDVSVLVERGDGGARSYRVDKLREGEDGETRAFELRPVTMKTTAGEPISSAVVADIGRPVARTKIKMPTGYAADALRSLRECVRQFGQVFDNGKPPPERPKAVTMDQWREVHFTSLGTLTTAERKLEHQGFRRAMQALEVEGWIARQGDHVWTTR